MARKIKYYLVAAEALPEIFIRVAEAKRMMQTGEADTVGAATKMAGISRSAFYKYKDAVQPFNDMKSEHIITFYTLLKDVSGTLSSVLGVFAASGANILTINQSIPTNGCAAVTISAETSEMQESIEEIWEKEKRTVVFVTNNIEEALYLADRIILLSDCPSQIRAEYKIDLPRPRDLVSPEFMRLRKEITERMNSAVY